METWLFFYGCTCWKHQLVSCVGILYNIRHIITSISPHEPALPSYLLSTLLLFPHPLPPVCWRTHTHTHASTPPSTLTHTTSNPVCTTYWFSQCLSAPRSAVSISLSYTATNSTLHHHNHRWLLFSAPPSAQPNPLQCCFAIKADGIRIMVNRTSSLHLYMSFKWHAVVHRHMTTYITTK